MKYQNQFILATSSGLYLLSEDNISQLPITENNAFIANSLSINNHIVTAISSNGVINIDLFESNKIQKPIFTQLRSSQPAHQRVIISVSSLNYPLRNSIEYQVQFNDADWLDMPAGKIELPHLNVGQHTIVARASFDGKIWQHSEPKIIVIVGTWYQSLIFVNIIISFVLTTVIMLCILFYRINKQKHKIFKRVTQQYRKHDLSSTYQQLLVAVDSLNSGTGAIVSEGIYQVELATEKIEQLLESYVTLGSLDFHHGISCLKALAQAQGVNTEFNTSIDNKFDKPTLNLLYFAAYHLVTNALKHSQCKFIQMNVSYKNGIVTLSVRDDGNGIKYVDHLINFGVGISSLKNIAYDHKTNLIIKSTRTGKQAGTFISLGVRTDLSYVSNVINKNLAITA